MITYNKKRKTYNLQKDVINLIIEKACPTLWMYFIKDDTLPNDVFNYAKIIQADSLEEAKKKIFFSNLSYLFKIRLIHMSSSFANAIISEYNIIDNDCPNCQHFLNRLHKKNTELSKFSKTVIDSNINDFNLYYKPHLNFHISWICTKHIPSKEQLLYIIEKHNVKLCIDELFVMVNYFDYREKRIALRKIEYC